VAVAHPLDVKARTELDVNVARSVARRIGAREEAGCLIRRDRQCDLRVVPRAIHPPLVRAVVPAHPGHGDFQAVAAGRVGAPKETSSGLNARSGHERIGVIGQDGYQGPVIRGGTVGLRW
jgi:hypothetical protein